MPYNDVQQRLADRRDRALGRMMIGRYSTRAHHPAQYPREPRPKQYLLSFLKRALRLQSTNLGWIEVQEALKKGR
jgi:hypothetical protein